MTETTIQLFDRHSHADAQRTAAADAAAIEARNRATGPGAAYHRVLDALDAGGYLDRRGDNESRARCPAHDGHDPNLAVRRGHTGVVLTCHSHQCGAAEVAAALELSMHDLFDEPRRGRTYGFVGGGVKRRVLREDGSKITPWDRGTRPALLPMWVPEVARLEGDEHGMLALAAATHLHLAEGEKAAEALAFMGVDGCPASWGGAADANKVDLSALAGKQVTVWPDRDAPGEKALQVMVTRAMEAGASSVKVQRMPEQLGEKSDAADLWETHGTEWAPHLPPVEAAAENTGAPAASATREAVHIVGRLASQVTPVKLRWLWADRIPLGTLAVFAGRGGEGKSTFAIYLAAQLTRGALEGQLAGQPVNVGIASLEDDEAAVTVPRLMGAGADLDRVHLFNADSAGLLVTLPRSADALAAYIREHELRAIILDPATSMMDGDHNKRHEVRASLDPLLDVANATGCTFILVQHLNKGGGNASDKVAGSAAFRDAARCLLLFAADTETGERIATFDKGNYSAELAPSLAFKIASATVEVEGGEHTEVGTVHGLASTDRDVQSVLNARYQIDSDDVARDRNEATQFLVSYLIERGGSALAREATREGKEAGFTESQIKKARLRCKSPKIETIRTGYASAVVWSLEGTEERIGSIGSTIGAMCTEVEPMEPMGETVEPMEPATQATVTPPDAAQLFE